MPFLSRCVGRRPATFAQDRLDHGMARTVAGLVGAHHRGRRCFGSGPDGSGPRPVFSNVIPRSSSSPWRSDGRSLRIWGAPNFYFEHHVAAHWGEG